MTITTFGLGEQPAETSPDILGGKGAGLVQMTSQGFRVPPGFILPTTMYAEYKAKPKTGLKAIEKEIGPYLDKLKAHFGYMPLLSVRSGAKVSCPGMMDTLLNIGLDSQTEGFWLGKLGEQCYTDSLRRLITMYAGVVKNVTAETHEQYQQATGEPFPMAKAQVLGAVQAVFHSWDNPRAKAYRKMNNIPDDLGTACVVQAMVFGNLNSESGSGVVFSRDTDTGLAKVNGDFLVCGQGEDVVDGSTSAPPLSVVEAWNPSLYTEIVDGVLKLEKLKCDAVDVEVTVQDNVLYYLQVRVAMRSAQAAIRMALDMEKEGLITPLQAVKRVSGRQVDLAVQPRISQLCLTPPAYTGIPACSGVVCAKPVFSAADAKASKVPCILVSQTTTPDDIEGMDAAVGVLTMQGGSTSHAAVVARGMNKPCVVGLGANPLTFEYMPLITLDGSTGRVWAGQVPITQGDTKELEDFKVLMQRALGTFPSLSEPLTTTVVDKAYTSLGYRMLSPADCVAHVKSLSKSAKKLYVDLTVRDDATLAYMRQLGFTPTNTDGVVHAMEKEQFQAKIVLIGAQSKVLPWVATTSNLEQLVLAEGEVMHSGADSPAVAKVLAWKANEGLKAISPGTIVPGQTSFMSFEQGLSLLA